MKARTAWTWTGEANGPETRRPWLRWRGWSPRLARRGKMEAEERQKRRGVECLRSDVDPALARLRQHTIDAREAPGPLAGNYSSDPSLSSTILGTSIDDRRFQARGCYARQGEICTQTKPPTVYSMHPTQQPSCGCNASACRMIHFRGTGSVDRRLMDEEKQQTCCPSGHLSTSPPMLGMTTAFVSRRASCPIQHKKL